MTLVTKDTWWKQKTSYIVYIIMFILAYGFIVIQTNGTVVTVRTNAIVIASTGSDPEGSGKLTNNQGNV